MNAIERLEKQYSAANQSYISARSGIEEALSILKNTSNPNSAAKATRLLESVLAEIKSCRKEF